MLPSEMDPAPSNEENIMGVVRCMHVKGSSRNPFVAYKKRFWVVDQTQGRLEVYKNDQEPFPLTKYSASEVRGIVLSGCKQNKFYGLVLHLRLSASIRFRFNSMTERDRWYAAITRLIEHYAAYNRDQNVLRVAQRRTMAAERLLGVSITLAIACLSEIPDDLLQYLVEAVDVAIDTISAVVHKYGSENDIPRRYTLTVAAAGLQPNTGPQYDPTTRSLVLNVAITRDLVGNVRFHVADSGDIMKITQSHVWRDPCIEGWLTTNESCVAVCREIGELLGLKKPFPFTFQWRENLRDTARVERYLRRYVHEDFLRDVQRQIVEVAEDFGRSEGAADDSVYIKYIGDYVSGIGITLDEKTVNAGKPPNLLVTTTVEYQQRCRHAVMMISKYREAYPKSRVMVMSLRDELVNLILLAELSKRMSEVRAAFSHALGGNGRVKIIWGNLLLACAKVGVPLLLRNLSHLVLSCSNIYLGRLESLQQLSTGFASSNEVYSPLFGMIFKNISSIVVDFVPFVVGTTKSLPDPQIQQNILTDYILCSTEEHQAAMMDLVSKWRVAPQANHAYAVVSELIIFPSMPVAMFKDWCEEKLGDIPEPGSNLGNASDSSSSWSSTSSYILGDAVAFERSAETQVLDMHRVVSLVYDSQGASVNLKIGADAIIDAIHSLEAAFENRRIRKHDLVRVLVSNLRRLRFMYSYSIRGEMTTSLDLPSAVTLLYELCEYEESVAGIEEWLRESAMQRQRQVHFASGTEPFAESSDASPDLLGQIYDFQCVSRVALNHLLPLEAKIARRGWRVGLVAGLENVGKTLILNSIKGLVQSTVPTVGLSRQVVAFQEWIFAMNELGGRETFRGNWRYYVEHMKEIDFLFFVVDSMNRRGLKDAAAYLRVVTDHFTTVPLVVVFNNYREGSRGTPSLMELQAAIKLDGVRHRRKERSVIVGTCDITVVSSAHRTLPPTLLSALNELSAYLLQCSSPERKPVQPKAGGTAESMLTRLSSSIAWRL
ncbi:putative ADP-ribosylation factor-like 2, arl2 [Trypanosoma conorhini]|uniref:Putative ADP-ribosylation factor-like 2, arl2 n=1 Tax=Trypanosoma conorhini TaxID=83891 RepID=A0A3R7LC43_9TRYP|nr:putative ADP-ribosylation factor-like 2, arl2 [Trypanosoma conorhini]RNF11423.1 putative ADP-ribosylation factor-like 2, arl2 [Trypanosoma conorhini]